MPDYQHEMIEETSGLPVRFMLPESDSLTIPAHWHEDLEILYLLKGELTAVIQANTYRLTPGQLMVVNSRELHMTQTKSNTSYLMIHMTPKELLRFLPGKTFLHFQTITICEDNPQVFSVLQECLLHMRRLFIDQSEGYELLFASWLYRFLFYLCQNFTGPSAISEKTGSVRDLQRITAIMEWVNSHYKESITLEDAAASLALSREYFCRLFKKYTGQTFLEYLNSVRTKKLYQDLKKSDENITILMEKNGITNYKVFMRTFKKMYGDTPQHIRSLL